MGIGRIVPIRGERNAPAVRLYQTVGYGTVWSDASATTLVPAVEEEVRNGGGGGGMEFPRRTFACVNRLNEEGVYVDASFRNIL